MRKPSTVLAVAATAFALLLAGCGGGDNSSKVASLSSQNNPTSGAAPAPGGGNPGNDQQQHDALLKFAKCMRDHGVDMPDPGPDSDGLPGVKPGDTKALAASDACKSLLPNGGAGTGDPTQEHDKMVKYAKCMRDHGIDIPDPKPGEAMALPQNTDRPTFDAAEKACGSILAG